MTAFIYKSGLWNVTVFYSPVSVFCGLFPWGSAKDLRVSACLIADNAANGRLTGNLFVNEQGLIGDIQKNPTKFSDVSGNAVYKMKKTDGAFMCISTPIPPKRV